MVSGGVADGESLSGGSICGWSVVCLLERGFGRASRRGCEGAANAGDSGWVRARGRFLGREASRGASLSLVEWCRCRFRRKDIPLCTPVGRGEGDLDVMAVATTDGGACAGNITSPVAAQARI